MNITLVPLQTSISIQSIRAFGCYLSSLVSIVANHFQYKYTPGDIERIYRDGIKRGAIKENDAPTDGSRGEWYRCFIVNPALLMKISAEYIGKEVNPVETFRKTLTNAKEKPSAPFYIYEYKTRYGSHFLATDKDENLYNPDPNIGLISLKSIRGWNI